jgi:ParB family chromosome partitioning protein
MTDKKNKYGDVDELLGDAASEESSTPTRRKRPMSPALGVMTGKTKPTRALDKVTAEKEQLAEQLAQEQSEKQSLLKQLEDAKTAAAAAIGAEKGAPIVLTMPVTKQQVSFQLLSIDPELVDVSVENERIQGFLDEISLRDILPSIKKQGQQKPGTVRPKGNGRFELIEGSRRLAAVKLAGHQYLALSGEVPDADVRDLSVIENKHRDVSPYEKAKAYQRQIESGEYANWQQLGAAKNISESHTNRFKKAAEMDELFVKILPSPSDMTLAYADDVKRLAALGERQRSQLFDEANQILQQRAHSLKMGLEPLDADGVFKRLKSAVRVKAVVAPTKKKPVHYRSKDGKVTLKHSITSSGSIKLELAGVSNKQLEKALGQLKRTLKVE